MSDRNVVDVVPVSNSNGEIVDIQTILQPLTAEEDMFCLAVIEYGGNLKHAFESVWPGTCTPSASARNLMLRPEIVLRIKDLTQSVTENALISLGSHLVELADIRDLAKHSGQLKVALNAEEARGKVAGLYIGKSENVPVKRGSGELENPMVVIQINTPHDAGI